MLHIACRLEILSSAKKMCEWNSPFGFLWTLFSYNRTTPCRNFLNSTLKSFLDDPRSFRRRFSLIYAQAKRKCAYNLFSFQTTIIQSPFESPTQCELLLTRVLSCQKKSAFVWNFDFSYCFNTKSDKEKCTPSRYVILSRKETYLWKKGRRQSGGFVRPCRFVDVRSNWIVRALTKLPESSIFLTSFTTRVRQWSRRWTE